MLKRAGIAVGGGAAYSCFAQEMVFQAVPWVVKVVGMPRCIGISSAFETRWHAALVGVRALWRLIWI